MKNAPQTEVMPSALDALASKLIILANTPLIQQASPALAPAAQVVLGVLL